MELLKLFSHQSLITEISDELVTFAEFLDIPIELHDPTDHIYITEPYGECCLESYEFRRASDVMVSSEVFCEVLMDIKSGMSVIDAYNKQGYTF